MRLRRGNSSDEKSGLIFARGGRYSVDMSNEYISPTTAAKKWGVSRQRVHRWLSEGRIPGAIPREILGKTVWHVPKNAKRPEKQTPGRKKDETQVQ